MALTCPTVPTNKREPILMHANNKNAARQNTGSGSAETHTGRQQEKIFTKDESEYVDFEEVK